MTRLSRWRRFGLPLLGLLACAGCGPESLEAQFIIGATREKVVLDARCSPTVIQQTGGLVKVVYRIAALDSRQLELRFTAREAGGGVGNYACGVDLAELAYRDATGKVFRGQAVCSISVVRPIRFYDDSREFKLQFGGRLFAEQEQLDIEEGRAQGIETASTPRIEKADVLID